MRKLLAAGMSAGITMGIVASILSWPTSVYGSDSATTAAKEVHLYSTQWCGYCDKARQYFKKQNIAFTEYDIELSHLAMLRYVSLGGTGGVPLITVDGEKMQGFSASGFQRLYLKPKNNK